MSRFDQGIPRCDVYSIKNNKPLTLAPGFLDEEDAVVSQENISSLCSVRRAAVTSSVQIVMMLEVACTTLFAWHFAAFKLH